MTIAEKLVKIAENEPKVYDAGQKAGINKGISQGYEHGYDQGRRDGYYVGYRNGEEKGLESGTEQGIQQGLEQGIAQGRQEEYDEFWENALSAANSFTARFAGWCWSNATLKPPERLTVTANCNYCFYSCRYTKNISDLFDFEGITNCIQMFTYSHISQIGRIDISQAASADQTFSYSKLVSIGELVVSDTLKYSNTFRGATDLESIRISGSIAQNNLSFADCTKLDRASIESIIFALNYYTENLVITFSTAAVDKAFETEEGKNDGSLSYDWDALKFERANWSIKTA